MKNRSCGLWRGRDSALHSTSEVENGGATATRWLVLVIAFIAALRLLLYATQPEFVSDFDTLYHAAVHFLRGEDPYPVAPQWSSCPLYYPFPAVIVAMPFSVLPFEPARGAFDIVMSNRQPGSLRLVPVLHLSSLE